MKACVIRCTRLGRLRHPLDLTRHDTSSTYNKWKPQRFNRIIMVDLYQYQNIPSPAHLHLTRVFTLAPGSRSDPVSGTLATMDVVSPVQFEALSYVWGRNGASDTIVCDGKMLQVTASVGDALRQLRDPVRYRVIWADQVCINQKNLVERSQQVRHMNSIYQTASKVVVWLGDDRDGHAERASGLIKSLVAVSRNPQLLRQFQEKQLEGGLDSYPREDWASLGELFKQPWVRSRSRLPSMIQYEEADVCGVAL